MGLGQSLLNHMNTNRTQKFYLIPLVFTLTLGLGACKTKPMYTEGDIHFEITCIESGDACQTRLQAACEAYDGEVVDVSIRREKFLSKEFKKQLKEQNREAKSVHVTCRPPVEEKEETDKEKELTDN